MITKKILSDDWLINLNNDKKSKLQLASIVLGQFTFLPVNSLCVSPRSHNNPKINVIFYLSNRSTIFQHWSGPREVRKIKGLFSSD